MCQPPSRGQRLGDPCLRDRCPLPGAEAAAADARWQLRGAPLRGLQMGGRAAGGDSEGSRAEGSGLRGETAKGTGLRRPGRRERRRGEWVEGSGTDGNRSEGSGLRGSTRRASRRGAAPRDSARSHWRALANSASPRAAASPARAGRARARAGWYGRRRAAAGWPAGKVRGGGGGERGGLPERCGAGGGREGERGAAAHRTALPAVLVAQAPRKVLGSSRLNAGPSPAAKRGECGARPGLPFLPPSPPGLRRG